MSTADEPREYKTFEGNLDDRAVHLCVDMQGLLGPGGPWETPWVERRLPRISSIAERAAAQTIFTRFVPPQYPKQMPGRWQRYYEHWREVTRERLDPEFLELLPELRRLVPPALILDKPVYSPFHGRRLVSTLRERAANAVVVTGAETDVCVLATILGAVDYGYRVVVVADAVCSSSDTGHDAVLTLLGNRLGHQIEMAETDEILEAWR